MFISLSPEIPSDESRAAGLSGKPQTLNSRHYLALLFIAIFGTYSYIVAHGDFIHLDDVGLVTRLMNDPSFVIKDLFFPERIGLYYRPMIELSYRLDYLLWFDGASGWHLTNVVIHAMNTGLVYLIALILFANHSKDREKAAFSSALLYGLNPLATESVCWVSGRSELIVAFFMLSSLYLYFIFKKKGSYTCLLSSGLLYLFAAWTKETAFALPLLFVALEFYPKRTIWREEWKKSISAAAYFILLTMAYFILFRRTGVDASLMHVGVGASGLRRVSFFENVLVLFASVGYYVRKIFVPYPLNFAICSINLLFYALCGLIMLVLFAARGRFLPPVFRFFAAWVLITITPAIAAAVLHLPWVQWGERYLYVPLAGYSMALGIGFVLFRMRRPSIALLALALLTGLFWVTTLQRTYLWAEEVRLWENTANQSDYGPVYYLYGKSLINDGLESEGIEQLEKAIAKGYRYDPYMMLSALALKKGYYEKSEEWLDRAIHDYPNNAELHKHLASNYLSRATGKEKSRMFLIKAIDEYMKYVAVEKKDGAAYLKIAQLYMAARQKQNALPFLEKAIATDTVSPSAAIARKYLRESRKGGNVP